MNTTELDKVFQHLINELSTLEASSKKQYLQVRKAAFTPELAKALHHEQTGIENHIKRLKLIALEHPGEVKKANTSTNNLPKKKYGRKKDLSRDLLMIAEAQQILPIKNAHYKLLLRLANALNLQYTPELLNQTIADNEATNTWLDKIAQRIISGETLIIDVAS